MMVPGSQARLVVGNAFNLRSRIVFRFERMEIRARAPRIQGTNSEGLPGSLRGLGFPQAAGNVFKRYPFESQLPGVAVWEIRVTQAHWDYDQCIYKVPVATPIIPQRYIGLVCFPNARLVDAANSYIAPCLYIEETSHVIEVMRGQPVDFTGYTNGPFQYPFTAAPEFTDHASIRTNANGIAPTVFPAN